MNFLVQWLLFRKSPVYAELKKSLNGRTPDEIIQKTLIVFKGYPQLCSDEGYRRKVLENIPKASENIFTSSTFISLINLFTYENLYKTNPPKEFIFELNKLLDLWKNKASFPTDKNKEMIFIMDGLMYKSPLPVIKIFYESQCVTPQMDKSVSDFHNMDCMDIHNKYIPRNHNNFLEKCNAYNRLDISQYLLNIGYIDKKHLPVIWRPLNSKFSVMFQTK
jgi:hypothetical protein